MPFYRVLEEEYQKLHQKDDGTPEDALAEITWAFSEWQILDARDLARRLFEARALIASNNAKRAAAASSDADELTDLSENIAATVLATDQLLDAALSRYFNQDRSVNNDALRTFKQAFANRLNELLKQANLREERSVQALTLSPYATALRKSREVVSEQKTREANRLFLEAAFPTQLMRIRDVQLSNTYSRIREQRHTALCLSGGGIRSGTFALGVVQALAEKKALTNFDYISTVSGGGFLGGWLSAWMKHAGAENVQEELRRMPSAKLDPEPVPVKHLRAFTNYLSPTLGLLSADTWTLVATYIRNVLLNWMVIVPLIAMAVFIPWGAVAVMNSTPADWNWLGGDAALFGIQTHRLVLLAYAIGFIAGAMAVRYVHSDEPEARKLSGQKTPTQGRTQNDFLVRCLAPLVLCSILLTTAFSLSWQWDFAMGTNVPDHLWRYFALFGALLHLVGWALAWPRTWLRVTVGFIVIIVTGGLIGAISGLIAPVLISGARMYVTFSMPVYLMLLMLSGQIYLGLVSRLSNDADREWGARFDAWIFIVVVSWAAISGIVLYGPELFSAGYRLLIGGGIGGISGVVTLLLGSSGKTSGKSETSASGGSAAHTVSLTKKVADFALSLAAPLFAMALIILISALDLLFMSKTCNFEIACRVTSDSLTSITAASQQIYPLTIVVLMLILLTLGWAFGRTVDTNEFSLHAMYRARLIRAYLGGSRPAGERRPDHFTGFDEDDDVKLRDLWPAEGHVRQPLHVVNVTLNLVAGEKLAWQERKAESFTMTPLHAGSAYLGYRRTSSSAAIDDESRANLYAAGELSLGTAVAISGAAASPNMGYHSSSVVTFLMTLFNARLGGWFGNPGPAGVKSYKLKHPKLAVKPILSELFGLSDDRSDYVYLSDGGHFENIALYEMVLRRCRFIIVSDASCDEDCSFNDLGNAIRKIRIDLGVPILFDEPMMIVPRSAPSSASNRAWAIGRIAYSRVDRPPNHRREVG